MCYIITYMNRIYLSPVDKTMGEEIERLLTEAGVPKEKQQGYWNFYQDKDNYTMNEKDYVVDYEPFVEPPEMDVECLESNFRLANCCERCEFSELVFGSVYCDKRKDNVSNTSVCDLFEMKEVFKMLEQCSTSDLERIVDKVKEKARNKS